MLFHIISPPHFPTLSHQPFFVLSSSSSSSSLALVCLWLYVNKLIDGLIVSGLVINWWYWVGSVMKCLWFRLVIDQLVVDMVDGFELIEVGFFFFWKSHLDLRVKKLKPKLNQIGSVSVNLTSWKSSIRPELYFSCPVLVHLFMATIRTTPMPWLILVPKKYWKKWWDFCSYCFNKEGLGSFWFLFFGQWR